VPAIRRTQGAGIAGTDRLQGWAALTTPATTAAFGHGLGRLDVGDGHDQPWPPSATSCGEPLA
jgi:hypothetical protein